MIYRLLYSLFKRGLLREFAREQNKPLTLTELSHAFTALDGTRYYRFPELMTLPIEREGRLQEYLMHIASGMNPDTITDILDRIEDLLTDGLTQGKNAAKIGALVVYMRDRVAKVLPSELFYHILAVQYIREDESPQSFNPDIHDEKVDQFKLEAESNSAFFLNTPELKRLQDLLKISDEQLTESLRMSAAIDKTIKNDLSKVLSSSTMPSGSEDQTVKS